MEQGGDAVYLAAPSGLAGQSPLCSPLSNDSPDDGKELFGEVADWICSDDGTSWVQQPLRLQDSVPVALTLHLLSLFLSQLALEL